MISVERCWTFESESCRLIIDPTALLTFGDPWFPGRTWQCPFQSIIPVIFVIVLVFHVMTLTLLTTTASYFLYPQFEFLWYFFILSFRLCILARASQKQQGILHPIRCHIISTSPITNVFVPIPWLWWCLPSSLFSKNLSFSSPVIQSSNAILI